MSRVDEGTPGPSADEALQFLIEGNERFVRGQGRSPFLSKQLLADLVEGQRPFATILGCSDSRVPPEILFDAGLGELFIVRVAGNIISPEVLGSLQYAGTYLRTPLFVVLGHEHCGAVQAALATKLHDEQALRQVQSLLDLILPGLEGLDSKLPPEELLQRAVEANVRWSISQTKARPEVQARIAEGKYKLVGAIYELATGRVRFLDP